MSADVVTLPTPADHTRRYFDALTSGVAGPGAWVLCTGQDGGGVGHSSFPAEHTDELAGQAAASAANGYDVWLRVCPVPLGFDPGPERRRGRADETVAFPGLYAEVDGNGRAVLDTLDGMKPPTMVVASGGPDHMQFAWLLDKAVIFDEQPDERAARARCRNANLRLHQLLEAMTGGQVDNLSELSRMLRLPGTLNHKYDPPAPVRLIRDNGPRYSLDELEAWLPTLLKTASGEQLTDEQAAEAFARQGTLDAGTAEQAAQTLLGQFMTRWSEDPDGTFVRKGRDIAGYTLACRLNDALVPRDLAEETLQDFRGFLPDTDTKGRHEVLTESWAGQKVDSAYNNPPEVRYDWPWSPGAGRPADGKRPRKVTGESFIYDEPDEIPAVWGQGQEVLWAEGEPLMLAGHQGTGKTTIAQQLVLRWVGALEPGLLGLPVRPDPRPVLYLAMDRPRQAARSFKRMVGPGHREAVKAGLVVWRGPLPFDPVAAPDRFASWVEEEVPGCGLVVVDSVKDMAAGVSKDEVGAALNSAWQGVVAEGVELILLHHGRKAQSGQRRGISLDDLYGSTWLTSGTGSVALLDGEPGNALVTIHHVKQPAEPVGPLDVRHDHARGVTSLRSGARTLLEMLVDAGDAGVTKEEVAKELRGRAGVAELKWAGNQLARLVKGSQAEKVEGAHTGTGRQPDCWVGTAQSTWAAGLAEEG